MRTLALKMVPDGQRKLYFRLFEQRCHTWQPVLWSANKPDTNLPFLSVHSKSVLGMLFKGAPISGPAIWPDGDSCGSWVMILLLEAAADDAPDDWWSALSISLDRCCCGLRLLWLLLTIRPSFAFIRLAFWTLSVGVLLRATCCCCTRYFRLFSSIRLSAADCCCFESTVSLAVWLFPELWYPFPAIRLFNNSCW